MSILSNFEAVIVGICQTEIVDAGLASKVDKAPYQTAADLLQFIANERTRDRVCAVSYVNNENFTQGPASRGTQYCRVDSQATINIAYIETDRQGLGNRFEERANFRDAMVNTFAGYQFSSAQESSVGSVKLGDSVLVSKQDIDEPNTKAHISLYTIQVTIYEDS